ncbi:MAG: hypothetical protein KGJ58_01580 [Patescibacteria group bacterium]|nr:hypothetical protein [Patescibacteria group bacterium]MDE1988567.1 hypothetical protein [Patescibacteria group bacterium]MDE2218129.1 hypothetical protein [Patescibacteria group bacterium]
MSFFSFSSGKNKEEVSAVFHIGSGNVNGYLVKLSKISKPEIVYAIKVPISFQKNIDLERHFSLMIKSLDSALKDIQKKGLAHLNFTGLKNHGVRSAFYILSSPWCVSQTKIIKIKKDKPFEISIDSIETVIDDQEGKFLSDDSTGGSKIIEKKIIEAKLNGYKMNEIYGKKAKDVELAFFMTSAPEYALKEVENVARKYFNFRSFDFHSSALSLFSAIRDIYSGEENFIFIDVHGELTDISIIKDNIFAESVSFPLGKNFFARQISKNFRVSMEEAFSLINLRFGDKSDSATSLKVQAAIDASLEDWLNKFHSILASLSSCMYIPRTVFMAADDEIDAFLVKKLKEEKFSQFSLTEESFNVIILDSKSLSEYCGSYKDFEKEPSAKLECVFLNKIFNAK